MPHYRNGDEAKVGDRLHFSADWYDPAGTWTKTVREGLVVQISPSAGTCNAQVVYPVLELFDQGKPTEARVCRLVTAYVTLGECDRV